MRSLFRVVAVTEKWCHCKYVNSMVRYRLSLFPTGIMPGAMVALTNGHFELYHGSVCEDNGNYKCRLYGGKMFYRKKIFSISELSSLIDRAEKIQDPSMLSIILLAIYDVSTLSSSCIPKDLSDRIDRCIIAFSRQKDNQEFESEIGCMDETEP